VSDTVPDRLARGLAEESGELRRGGARGEPPWLEHEEPSRPDPRGVEEGERDARRLARARGRDEDRGAAIDQRRSHVGEHGVDRERRSVAEGVGDAEHGSGKARAARSGGAPRP